MSVHVEFRSVRGADQACHGTRAPDARRAAYEQNLRAAVRADFQVGSSDGGMTVAVLTTRDFSIRSPFCAQYSINWGSIRACRSVRRFGGRRRERRSRGQVRGSGSGWRCFGSIAGVPEKLVRHGYLFGVVDNGQLKEIAFSERGLCSSSDVVDRCRYSVAGLPDAFGRAANIHATR